MKQSSKSVIYRIWQQLAWTFVIKKFQQALRPNISSLGCGSVVAIVSFTTAHLPLSQGLIYYCMKLILSTDLIDNTNLV